MRNKNNILNLLRVLFVAAAGWSQGLSALAGEQARTWTSESGTSIQAVFTGYEQGRVLLESTDGQSFAIPAARLDPASREYVEQKIKAINEEQAKSQGAILFQGSFPAYSFEIRKPGHEFVITPGNCAGGAGMQIPCEFMAVYKPQPHLGMARKITNVINVSFMNNTYKATLLHAENVVTQIEIDFERDKILVGLSKMEPEGIKFPGSHRLLMHMPAVASWNQESGRYEGYAVDGQQVSGHAIADVLDSVMVNARTLDRKQLRYSFDNIAEFPSLEWLEFSNVYCKKRVIRLDSGSDAYFSKNQAHGEPLRSGFVLLWRRLDDSESISRQNTKMAITFKDR